MKPLSFKDAKLGLCGIGLGLLLAGCGRNGAPLPPPGVSEDRAVPYINENTSGAFDSHNSAQEKQVQQARDAQQNLVSGTQPGDAPAVPAKPKKPFFLDPLL